MEWTTKSFESCKWLIKKVNTTHGNQIIFACDFNLFFNSNLEAKGLKPILNTKICFENGWVHGWVKNHLHSD